MVVCLAAHCVAAFHTTNTTPSYVLDVILPIMCVHSIVVWFVTMMSSLERVLLVVA